MRVYSNTAMSADGKISARRDAHVFLGTEADRERMSVLRAGADAVFVGGQTFRNWPIPLLERPEHRRSSRRRPIVNAVITARGIVDARAARARWPHPEVELLVFGPPGLDAAAHRARFGATVLSRERPDVEWVLDELAARGCDQVLVEGGGGLIGAVLAAGRLDEMYLTVCPKVVGGPGAPTPVDAPAFPPEAFPQLRLAEVTTIGDEVFLHYAVRGGNKC